MCLKQRKSYEIRSEEGKKFEGLFKDDKVAEDKIFMFFTKRYTSLKVAAEILMYTNENNDWVDQVIEAAKKSGSAMVKFFRSME